MATTYVDQITGGGETVAQKAPCRLATAVNIVLSGHQMVDGEMTVDNDRIVVRIQTDPKQNGIYIAAAGAWQRARDFDSNRDVTKGTRVAVVDGATFHDNVFVLDSDNPVHIGLSDILFRNASVLPGEGDMQASMYDPQDIQDDAFARANHTGTQSADTIVDGSTNKAFTATEKTKLAGIASGATANSPNATLLARANHTGTQSADTVVDGTTNKAYTAAEKTKLSGIASGATANSSDATLLARANHTGTQSADTITDGTTNKAFTATEKTKLSGIATAATANSSDGTLLARANHTGTQLASTISDFSTAADARITAALGVTAQAYSAALAGIAGLSPPGADRILFWDHSALAYVYLTIGSNLSITGTTLNATGGGGGSGGDMFAIMYDPQGIENDAFDRSFHTGTQLAATISDFSTAADARISAAIGVTAQAYSAALTTLAGLTATTDNFIVSVSNAWASRTPAQVRTTLGFTANGYSLISAANYAAMRALLDLEPGTDFYSISAANAAFATSANASFTGTFTPPDNTIALGKLAQSTGPSVVGRSAASAGSNADIQASTNDRILARVSNALSWVQLTVGMIADGIITYAKMASGAIASTSELLSGTASKLVDAATVHSSMAWVAITAGSAPAIDHAAGFNRTITHSANATFGAPSNSKPGMPLNIDITPGAFTSSWNAVYKFGSGGAPSITSRKIVHFICRDSSTFVFLGTSEPT